MGARTDHRLVGQIERAQGSLGRKPVTGWFYIDMVKALDKALVIGPIRLIEKTGGKSGDWRADAR